MDRQIGTERERERERERAEVEPIRTIVSPVDALYRERASETERERQADRDRQTANGQRDREIKTENI